MSTQPLDAIKHLDFHEIRCQCTQHVHACPNRATHLVHIHALNACNEPGLSYGNRVELRCRECVLRLIAEVGYRLDKANQWGIAYCATCQAPMVTVGDVVRSWEELA